MVRSFLSVLGTTCVFFFVCQSIRAEIVLSTFEEGNLATKLNSDSSYEGLTEVASQFKSGSVTFENDGVYFGGSTWSGFGYSQRTAPGLGQDLYNNSNDLIARPAVGAGGSTTWAVVGSNGVMTADAGYRFATIDITNTLYTWNSLANGDTFAGGPMSNGGGTGRFTGQDDFFTVRFTNTATSAFLDFNLADYRGDADNVNSNWQSFSLFSLDASQLSISFLGSRETNYNDPPDPPVYFMDTPAYAAFDNVGVVNVSVVPEPSSLCLVSAIIVGVVRRRIRIAKA